MGNSTYDSGTYQKRLADIKAKKQDYFGHTADITSGEVKAGVHPLLDPARPNAAGKITRESFDSPAHPNSVPVVIGCDITGSMTIVPRIFVEKMGTLMDKLTKSGYLEHPHILLAAFGDAYSDRAPLQVGQYEGGNEMDNVLGNFYLEGGGGGSGSETSELLAKMILDTSDLDSVKKRNKKGYFIIISDETPYPKVDARVYKDLTGIVLPHDIPTSEVFAELRKKFEIFWIMPAGTNHWQDTRIISTLTKYFGSRYLRLDDVECITEVVAAIIALGEGKDLGSILMSLTAKEKKAVEAALDPYIKELGATASAGSTLDF